MSGSRFQDVALNLRGLCSRRYILLGLAVTFLLIVYQLQEYRFPAPSASSIVHYSPAPRPDNGRWMWTDYKPRFPLQSITPLPSAKPQRLPRVQHKFGTESHADRATRLERQKVVKDTFKRCWQSYHDMAWMKDELAPLSGGGNNFFGGWSASLVDALDTLWIMDLKDEFKEATAAAMKIDFSTSTDEVINVFETTIRYLGGFLAAYDLSGDIQLLHKAVEIGEMLLVPFDTPNHMPIARWHWKDAAKGDRQEASDGTLVSEIGSLTMEFTRLSQLTGDPRWYDAVDRITRIFDAQQSQTKLPGMWPIVVNARDEIFTRDTAFTLGGMADSLYEYFPKTYALLGGAESVYQKLYENSMATAAEHLFFRPMSPQPQKMLLSGDVRAHDDGTPATLEAKGQHLTCFVGGMLALGGRLFGNEQHVAMAKQHTDGCVWAYNTTSVGVMPEIAQFVPCSSKETCPWNEETWKAAVLERSGDESKNMDLNEFIAKKKLPPGFSKIPDARYILRPEALESVFYMYRVTGDRSYPEAAWQMFNSILHISKTGIANAAVRDITATDANGLPPKDDRMESFWLAETLKYAYLIFSEPELISLDEYVLNTEAHPFRRPK